MNPSMRVKRSSKTDPTILAHDREKMQKAKDALKDLGTIVKAANNTIHLKAPRGAGGRALVEKVIDALREVGVTTSSTKPGPIGADLLYVLIIKL